MNLNDYSIRDLRDLICEIGLYNAHTEIGSKEEKECEFAEEMIKNCIKERVKSIVWGINHRST